MSPCCGSSHMHFKRQKIALVLLALLERVPPPNPLLSQKKVCDGKEVFLAGNIPCWDGFRTTTAALNIIFQGQVKIPS